MISQGPFQPQWFYEIFFYVNKHEQIWSNIDFQHCSSRGSLSTTLWGRQVMGRMRDVFPCPVSLLKPQGVLYRFKRNKTHVVLKRGSSCLGLSILLWVWGVFLGPFKEVLYQDLDAPFTTWTPQASPSLRHKKNKRNEQTRPFPSILARADFLLLKRENFHFSQIIYGYCCRYLFTSHERFLDTAMLDKSPEISGIKDCPWPTLFQNICQAKSKRDLLQNA